MSRYQSELKKSILANTVAAVLVGTGTVAYAEYARLEEIVVTAQKREQSLQEVPISVQVISGDDIAKQDISSALELSTTVPGFVVSKDGPADNISIRGVSSGGNTGFEQSAATFVDGVYRGRSRQIRTGFLDIGQIEVLKGPQSTFFGNNAIAGALNITSARPTDEFEGYANIQYEPDWEETLFTAAISGPLNDELKGRVAISQRDRENGYAEVLDASGNVSQRGPLLDETLARVSLTWEPTDEFTAFLRVDYSESEVQLDRVQELFGCPAAEDAVPGSDCFVVLNDYGPEVAATEGLDYSMASPAALGNGTELETSEFLLTLTYDIDDKTLTSVTSYSEYDNANGIAVGQTPPPPLFLGIGQQETFEQFSQEIRIASDSSGPINFMAGLYYQRDSLTYSPEFNFQFLGFLAGVFPELAPLAPFGYDVEYDQDTEVMSTFAAVDWDVTEELALSFGLRYTDVSKDIVNVNRHASFETNSLGGATPFPDDVVLSPGASGVLNGLAVAGSTQASRSDSEVLYSLGASYQLNEDMMLYAKYSKGFKAGGFDFTDRTLSAEENAYEPELAYAFEGGFKSTFADGAATLNIAAFYTDYEDLQETSWITLEDGSFRSAVANAAEMTTQGIEVEAGWAVTEQLRTSLSVAYVDAQYNSFPNATCTTAQQIATPEGETCTQDLTDTPRPFNAELSGNLSFDYELPLSEYLLLTSHLSLYYADGYSVSGSREPGLFQESYTKVSARISIGDVEDTWDISLTGKNLTDEKILMWGAANADGSFVGQLEDPSFIAIKAGYRW